MQRWLKVLGRPALFLLMILGVSGATRAATPADDAYHFAAWADGRHDLWYTEWWYFNLFDPETGLEAIFSYFVTNPKDILGLGQVRMVASVFTEGDVVTAIDLFPMDAFSADEARVDTAIDANRVEVQSDGSYRVSGASRDQRIAWDLAYEPESEPWLAADRMTVGRLPWEQMSWLIGMPRARVTGEIKVDGRSYAVDAPGYHDHNWGEWIPTDGMWAWGQFSDHRLDLEIGDFIGKPIGVVGLALDGERTLFDADHYLFVHTHWGWDAGNRLFYPTESVLTAEKGDLRLRLDIRVLETEPLRGDLPFPLRDLIIYEQTAWYEGRLWQWVPAERGPAGRWQVKARISGPGFKEWTGKHY